MVNYSQNELSRFNGQIISPKIILIRPKSNFLTSNTIIFDDQDKLVVDAGFQHGTGQLETVRDFFNISSNDFVYFSHHHLDHLIGSYVFSDSVKFIHFSEKEALKSVKSFLKFCFKSRISQYDLEKWVPRFLDFLKYEGLSEWQDLGIGDVQPIHHNKPLELGDISLEIIHLPGHSPGHCGLYDHESQVIFIADIDLRRFGPWYGWKNSNLQLFQKSVESLTSFIETHAISLVISSHTRPIDKHECLNRLMNFKQVFDVRKKKILEYISKKKDGTTIEEITNQSFIYQESYTDQSFVNHVFERHHIEHHVDELIKEKRIYNNGDIIFLA